MERPDIMTHLEMRNVNKQYDHENADMSAQERLIFNNNYNKNHHQHHASRRLEENQYQIMTHLEMTNFDMQNNPEYADMSTQERLLFNNNYSNTNQQLSDIVLEEHQYQVPYAHLLHHPCIQQQHQLQQQQQQQQQVHALYSGSGQRSSYGRVRSLRPSATRTNRNHYQHHHHPPSPMPVYCTGQNYHHEYSAAYPAQENHLSRCSNHNNGSGIAYRPRRKLLCVAAMVALFLLFLAGSVVFAIYFTIIRQESAVQEVLNVQDEFKDTGGKLPVKEEDIITRQPHYVVKPVKSTPHPPQGSSIPNLLGTKVKRFDAYWHPGDSRLFVASLSNGTSIQVFGPKKSDGTVKSVYSLSLSGPDRMVRSIRFLGQRSLASVVLPDGVTVSYDWSPNNHDMEIKVFEPFSESTLGPISHIALVDVGVRSYLLRKISNAMADIKSFRTPLLNTRRGSLKCFSRFPVKVTKCGGKYPYDGAFVKGDIAGIDTPITMAALPWPKEPDPCYVQESETQYNYYLPLPGHVDDDNVVMIKYAYTASSARIFTKICNAIKDHAYEERQKLCRDIADKVTNNLYRPHVMGIIYDSCNTMLNSLHTICFAISGIASTDKEDPLTEKGLMRELKRRLSNSFPPDLPDQFDIKVNAFCPSSDQIDSFSSTVSTHTIRGNVARDYIHINCPNYPEVTKVDLGHLLTTSLVQSSSSHYYDMVKHKMRICSICSFENTVYAKIMSDQMICNNSCVKNNMAENIPKTYVRESKEYIEQDSVYCHDFLTDVDNHIEPLGQQCVANCMSYLRVKFQIRDLNTEVLYYDQTVQCSELRSHSCKMKFGR